MVGGGKREGGRGEGEGGGFDSLFQTIAPTQSIICTILAFSGNGLDKGSAGVPAGARALCIQVLAPRSKAHWHVLVRGLS